MFHPYGNMRVQHLNNYRNVAFSPYYFKYIERSAHYMEKRNFDNYKDYSWETSKYFYEENFDFLNYERQTYGNKINNEEYTYKGENDFLYTTLTEDEYLYAMIVEDFLGVKGFSKEN